MMQLMRVDCLYVRDKACNPEDCDEYDLAKILSGAGNDLNKINEIAKKLAEALVATGMSDEELGRLFRPGDEIDEEIFNIEIGPNIHNPCPFRRHVLRGEG